MNYTGVDNLEVMQLCVNYHNHLLSLLQKAIGEGRTLLDFGAGLGQYAIFLKENFGYEIECVEKDPALKQKLSEKFVTYSDLNEIKRTFDVIYLINVLEHIEDDQAILLQFKKLLNPGGKIFVYVPAFNLLFSSMDAKVGHFRRYNKRDLSQKALNAGLKIDRACYADSMGFFVTLLYKAIGSSKGDITPLSIKIFDRFIFPLNRVLDKVFGTVLGKNLLVVARRDGN